MGNDEIDKAIWNDPRLWTITFAIGRELYRQGKVAPGAWKKQYDEYLSTDAWRSKAEAAKKRAGYRCQLCYSDKNLQVHHRTYERLGEELDTDLTVLCEECHYKFHTYIEDYYS